MFTGIIEAVGEVAALQMRSGDLRLYIRSGDLPLAEVKLGDSIASNGVCLTVVDLPGDGFWADVSRETLAHSSFAEAKTGMAVNLERAMLASSRFDGHIVSGHVDGVGTIVAMQRDARSLRLSIDAPENLARYIAQKGSICVDGVSLTVNRVDGASFELNIVPHTAAETTIASYRVGSRVNLEVDVVARYLERLLDARSLDSRSGGITMATLAENGFMKAK
ncbi:MULTISPECIES: riboflavin synthase [Spongiibacter]|uniref:riboflavin synthase n=1 Tax=Spongiibacter TaxID=630749 RepID=UPI000C4BC9D5|nr:MULTISPECIES: riboflavin synthase [Spongiibacter]MAY38779.1 riboflavin synthase [Spongiibacter sp.]MBI57107.1 riboflavin synthase [Spongiibacter sp.]MBO6753087.1 riboflavin synthase [Spongiibacter sp.]MBU72473.1 riboflavin synthase [Spongiibacter sp.]